MEKKALQRKPARIAAKAVHRQYTMLLTDAELIEKLRHRYQREALKKKKRAIDIVRSEVVRAGIHHLQTLSDEELYEAIEAVEELIEGRPKRQSA